MIQRAYWASIPLAAAVSLSAPSAVWATSAEAVLDLRLMTSCKTVLNDDSVIDASTTALPNAGGSGSVIGPDGQQIDFTMGDNNQSLTSWEIVDQSSVAFKPVTVVLLTYQREARLFHYGERGASADTELDGDGQQIHRLQFCYGLAVENLYLGDCDELAANHETLDGTAISCPDDEARVLISLDVTPVQDPDERRDFNRAFCSCNAGRLPECDPDQSRSDTDSNNACTNNPDGRNERPPLSIQGVENPGSYICFTSGGRRVCYGHF